jgi:hypothetical protein
MKVKFLSVFLIFFCLIGIASAHPCVKSINDYTGVCTAKYDRDIPQIHLEENGVTHDVSLTEDQFKDAQIGSVYRWVQFNFANGKFQEVSK